ncbi:TauD/TfdA family dioxygenase [Legionella israelensis]|uniref:TauD/TfdA dioxygenase family protein n=1 Tax=Legionella israelensis TaxID=454 RepID=UPI00117C2DE1|nr:TauD/TfdA family dioxygenase [Legionella israelensis]QDP73288.1 TauD/TfdA family dioxygenase [Legionella israelensis]
MNNFEISPLSHAIGVELTGFQLHPKLSQSEVQTIQEIILEHQIVVFRDQQLTVEQQIKTCGLFGPIEPHPLKDNTCKYKEITYVSNVTDDGKAVGYPGPAFHIWHSDMCYEPVPPKFSFLFAEKVPTQGGNTLFANTQRAFADLKPNFQKQLLELNAVFGFSEKLMQRCKGLGYELVINPCDQRPDCIHPVIRTHPITKKQSIFVNWTHTDCILGMSESESQSLLTQLFEHYTQDKYCYSHQYRENDLIVWDNSSTMHTGDGTVAIDKPRIMRRVVVQY